MTAPAPKPQEPTPNERLADEIDMAIIELEDGDIRIPIERLKELSLRLRGLID